MNRRRLLLLIALATLLATAGPLACQKGFDDRLTEARTLQEQGDFAASIERLRELASEQPDHGEVSFLLGRALASTGETSASFWPLRKAAETPEYALQAGLLLSRLLQQTNNHVEAIAAAEGVLEADPENVDGMIYLARSQILAKRHEDGLASAERALAADDTNIRGYWLRAAALSELDRPEEAADAFARMRSEASGAGELALEAQACTAEADLRASKLEQVEAATTLLATCIEDQPGAVALVRAAAQLHVENDESARAEEIWRRAVEAAPDALKLRQGLAQHLAAEERWDDAIAVLSEAVDDFGTIEASAALAELHVDHDDNAAAEAVLAAAAERLGDSDPLRFQRADLLLEEGDLDGAEALAGSIQDPLRRDVVMGRVLFFRGDYAGSLIALERALERWPDNPGVRYIAGRAYQALGDHERAIEEYRTAMRANLAATDAALAAGYLALALGNPTEALQYILYHVRGRPYRSAEPYVIGARAAVLSRKPKVAGELLDHLASQEGGLPAAVAERARLEGEADPSAGVLRVEKSELDLTVVENEAVLEVQSELLIAAGRADEALVLVDLAVAARPGAVLPLALRARVLAALDRPEDARAAAELALAADPESAKALAAMARIEFAGGRADEAIALYDRAAAADDADIDSPYRAAQLEYAAGRSDEARTRLRALLARAPAHVGASNDLAYLLAEEGANLDEALAFAQRAALLSGLPEVVDTLATVRIARGEEAVAQELLEKALEAHPDSGTLRYRLGVALEKAGDPEAALGSFRTAVEGGDFPQQESARAEIARLESTSTVQ